MASGQSMTKATTQAVIKAAKAAIIAVRESEGPTKNRRWEKGTKNKCSSTETANT